MTGWLWPWVQLARFDQSKAALLLGLTLMAALLVRRVMYAAVRESHRRGTLIARRRSRFWPGRRAGGVVHGRLGLAGVPIMPADELKHFKLIGTTGTGKSTAIRELLALALRRGDRAVISDPDGGYAL